MSDLYPLLMQPLFDPRPWGTLDLSPIYSQRFHEKIGESWLTGDHCKIQNGPLAGKSLAEAASQYKRELVGAAAADESRFPLLREISVSPREAVNSKCTPMMTDARAIGLAVREDRVLVRHARHADRRNWAGPKTRDDSRALRESQSTKIARKSCSTGSRCQPGT